MVLKEKIPIKFEHEGSIYEGHFTCFESTTGFEFQAIFNGYYRGILIYYGREESWVFYTNTPNLKKLTEYFGEYIIAWSG